MVGFIRSALLAAFLVPAILSAASFEDRLPQDEIIYFVLPDRFANGSTDNDRGGIEGGVLDHGFDPTHKGFYQGGDLKGLTDRLDYVAALGATAIWLTPIFENKAVQGDEPWISAGYHGYWITDFANVDPHIGTREDFKALVDAAHARDMKVYMDIITNHTADVIAYRECHDPEWSGERVEGCRYRSVGEYPWTTRGGIDGETINAGFLGDDPEYMSEENFARLTDPTWAYTPFIRDHEKTIKNPAWLNDLTLYHNRGETTYEGENSVYGDFAGLDDLNTQHPRVIDGFIEIYKQWITDFRVDGFRIDTAKHVRPEFWARFTPAIVNHAHSLGIEHFHVFGEVYEFDPGQLARYTIEARLPSVLDFAFQKAVEDYVVAGAPAQTLRRLFAADVVYAEGRETAAILPTFIGNHDMGRLSGKLVVAHPKMDDEERLRRLELAHAVLLFARGVPTIYYGDEQGFVSDGNDQDAREAMFESRTAVYNDNDLIGTDATTADANFDLDHPLFRAIAKMAGVRQAESALRRGQLRVRHADLDGGLFVFSRIDAEDEVVVAVNAERISRRINVAVGGARRDWSSLLGECQETSPAAGVYSMSVPALGYVVCKGNR